MGETLKVAFPAQLARATPSRLWLFIVLVLLISRAVRLQSTGVGCCCSMTLHLLLCNSPARSCACGRDSHILPPHGIEEQCEDLET